MMDTDNHHMHISARSVKVDTKHIQFTVENKKEEDDHNPQTLVDSDDDFMQSKRPNKKASHTESKQSDIADELLLHDQAARPLIFGMFPHNYTYYEMMTVDQWITLIT